MRPAVDASGVPTPNVRWRVQLGGSAPGATLYGAMTPKFAYHRNEPLGERE
jgi:hypothetical protein